MDYVIGIGIILGVFFLYFLPTCIAMARRHRNEEAILLVNLLLGWTLLGWVAALIWAVYRDRA